MTSSKLNMIGCNVAKISSNMELFAVLQELFMANYQGTGLGQDSLFKPGATLVTKKCGGHASGASK